jgi:hypothetical protein
VQEQQEQNQELIRTASQILELTTDIHASTTSTPAQIHGNERSAGLWHRDLGVSEPQ